MSTEVKRLKNSRQRILHRLAKSPATGNQLSRIALRFGARIKELRDSGYKITRQYVRPGVYRYTLIPGLTTTLAGTK